MYIILISKNSKKCSHQLRIPLPNNYRSSLVRQDIPTPMTEPALQTLRLRIPHAYLSYILSKRREYIFNVLIITHFALSKTGHLSIHLDCPARPPPTLCQAFLHQTIELVYLRLNRVSSFYASWRELPNETEVTITSRDLLYEELCV